MGVDRAVGNIVARPDEGNYVVQNIGDGIALNLRYRFSRGNERELREMRYVPAVGQGARVRLVEPLGAYNAEHRVIFEYESVSGKRYRTTIELNHQVITSFVFREV